MIDLQLPTPLLTPARWPVGEARHSIFSFKFGGAFETTRAKSFVVPETFWIREANDEPSLVAILREQRLDTAEIVSRTALPRAEQDEWRKLGATRFTVDPILKSPTLDEWSREVFPRAFQEAGEVAWHRELRDYSQQLGGGAPSLDSLRFWPAFLRSRKQTFAATAALEWARVQALFSPQDDASGDGRSVLLNPTLQVVADQKMFAVWRVNGEIHEREVTWEEAAVIDEMRESPRQLRVALLHELNARSFKFAMSASFDEIIERMTKQGLLVKRD